MFVNRSKVLRKASNASDQKKSFNNVVEKAKRNSDSTSKSTVVANSENSSSTLAKTSVSLLSKSVNFKIYKKKSIKKSLRFKVFLRM